MTQISDRVLRWQKAWEGADPDAVAALYASAAIHASAAVKAILPSGATELNGPAQLRRYAEAAFARVKNRRFKILGVTTQGARDVVEYLRHSSIDTSGPKHVVEILEWDDDLLAAVRVFHF